MVLARKGFESVDGRDTSTSKSIKDSLCVLAPSLPNGRGFLGPAPTRTCPEPLAELQFLGETFSLMQFGFQSLWPGRSEVV